MSFISRNIFRTVVEIQSILLELLDDLGFDSMLLPISNPAAATNHLLSDSLNL